MVVAASSTNIPARLDRLPWSPWHARVVVALGITWLLDGLEGTLAGSLAGVLKQPEALGLSDAQLGVSGSFYLLGSVLGALVFGHATDRWGRKKLFSVTLLVYLSATAATAFSWNLASFAFFRALTGAGIGGEYAAINSAVDELIPRHVRGHVDLLVNGDLLDRRGPGRGGVAALARPAVDPARPSSWRFAFGVGAAIGVVVLAMRRHVPESPRWLLGPRQRRARPSKSSTRSSETSRPTRARFRPRPRRSASSARDPRPYRDIWRAIVDRHRRRSVLGLTLMVTQAFFYNAVLFTYGLVLLRYYAVSRPTASAFTSSPSPSATSSARSCSAPSSTRGAASR